MATLTRTMTYAELVAAITAGTLNKGESITISDFATTHYFLDGDLTLLSESPNVATPEPLTVLVTSSNTIDCIAKSSLYPQDIIHYDWNPDNWINDKSFSDVNDVGLGYGTIIEGFKGVITYREDTIQKNKTHYDFRGVKFRRWAIIPNTWDSGVTYSRNTWVKNGDMLYRSLKNNNTNHSLYDSVWWAYVINTSKTRYWSWDSSGMNGCPVDSNDYVDYHTWVSYIEAGDNEIGLRHSYWNDPVISTILPNIVFVEEGDSGDGYVITSNKFKGGDSFGDSSIGADFSHNNIESNFHHNCIGAVVKYNIIGADFTNNTIGEEFYHNNIGSSFKGNIIGTSFTYNNIGTEFGSNTIGSNSYSNAIGSYFHSNSIGGRFYSNTIGPYFNSNTIGKDFCFNNIGEYFENNIIADYFHYVMGTASQINFTNATHVYANYTCTLFRRMGGAYKILYYDSSNVAVVNSPNS